mgnify:CR=1 FL=1
MLEPVVDALGNTYDKECALKWFEDHVTAYQSTEKLPNKTLTPLNKLRIEIIELKESKIKKGLAVLPKLLKQTEHFPLVEKLLDRITKYNSTLKNNFSKLIIQAFAC